MVNGQGNFEPGDVVGITATANAGWEFVEWTGDTDYIDDSHSAAATVTMPADDVNITANFQQEDGWDIIYGDGVTDIDGNEYVTVIIGEQEWMAENLRVTRYNNEDVIPTGLNDEDWGDTTEGAYAIYDHNHWGAGGMDSPEEIVEAYGKLYNWYAVDDARGLCPEGWSVPSDDDWTQLVDYIMHEYDYHNEPWSDDLDGVGNALKSCRQDGSPLGADCDTSDHPRWNSNNTHYGFDRFGFSALPGGRRSTNGPVINMGASSDWWSSTESGTNAVSRVLQTSSANVFRTYLEKASGRSIRCVLEETEDPTTYNLHLEAQPENAGSVTGAGEYQEGEGVAIEATANEGWEFVNWTGDTEHLDDPVSASTTVTMPAEDVQLTANFELIDYSLTLIANPEEGGNVSGGGQYVEGEQVNIAATASAGWAFEGWTGDTDHVGDSASANTTVTMPAEDVDLTANFSLITYQLVLEAEPVGGGTVSGAGEYPEGQQVSISAEANTGYRFLSWEEGTETFSFSPDTMITMNSNRELIASFALEQYQISVQTSNEDFGSVTGAGTYEHFEQVTLTAIPETGYHFVEWTEDGEVVLDGDQPAGKTYIFTAEEDRNLVAHFAINTYEITAQSNNDDFGTVSGSGTYEHGEWVTLEAEPDAGYSFVNWTEDGQVLMDGGEPVGNIYAFAAEQDRSLIAHFELKSYSITATASPWVGGTINGQAQHTGIYDHGEEITLSASPNGGFSFTGWSEGASPIEDAGQDYTFTVTADRTLVASFETEAILINAEPDPLEGGTIIGGGVFAYGDLVTLVALPAEGHHFVNWTEDGVVIEDADEVHGFTAETNRNLVANFGTEDHTISVEVFPGGAGTISGDGIYTHGETVSLEAQAEEGYRFVSWREGGYVVSTEPNYGFTAVHDRMLVAVFAEKTYQVTLETSPENNLGGTTYGEGSYQQGSTVTVIANHNLGYDFDHWSEDGDVVSTEQIYDFDIHKDRHLTAVFSGNHYEITANVTPAETGHVSGEGTYYDGEVVALMAQAADGYYFLRWMEGDDQVSVSNPYYFSASSERTLTAEFAEQWWPDDPEVKDAQVMITAEVTPQNTGVVLGQGFYDQGSQVTLTASPNIGVEFTAWMEDGDIVTDDQGDPVGQSYTFTAEQDRELVAVFEGEMHAVSVTAEPVDGGQVEVTQEGNFFEGELATVTASPGTGHAFTKWTLGSNGAQLSGNPVYSFTVTEDRELVAHFEPLDEYTLSMEAIPQEAGTLSGEGDYSSGTEVDIHAQAVDGYHFQYWVKDGSIYSEQSDTSIVVSDDTHLEGIFSLNTYVISAGADPAEGGNISGAGHYNHSEDVELTAIPSTGHEFLHWTEDGDMVMDEDEPMGETYLFTASEDRHLSAHFALKSYDIEAQSIPEEGGAVNGTGTYDHFEQITLEAMAGTGYSFSHWEEGGDIIEGEEATISFMVTRDRCLVAHFAINTYVISAAAGEGGSIDPDGDVVVDHGESQLFTITPDEGYEIIDVLVDGDSVGAVDQYEFTDVTDNHTIEAIFELKTYVINATAGEGGSIDPDGDVVVDHGESQLFTITPDEGYEILDVLIDGESVGAVEDYEFTGVTRSHTIAAEFYVDETGLETLAEQVTVYPNPFNNTLTIANASGLRNITLKNLFGQTVFESEMISTDEEVINTESLSPGVYFLRMAGTDGSHRVLKMMKE